MAYASFVDMENHVGRPWAWSRPIGPVSSTLYDINVPRASIFEDKRCEESLGLEKLAVGRNDLLPLCGTANSPSTCVI